MKSATVIEICDCRKWTRNGRVLVEATADKIEIKACEVDEADQAAICYVLLTNLSEKLGIAPFAVDARTLATVEDALSSLAEFPDLNRV